MRNVWWEVLVNTPEPPMTDEDREYRDAVNRAVAEWTPNAWDEVRGSVNDPWNLDN